MTYYHWLGAEADEVATDLKGFLDWFQALPEIAAHLVRGK